MSTLPQKQTAHPAYNLPNPGGSMQPSNGLPLDDPYPNPSAFGDKKKVK